MTAPLAVESPPPGDPSAAETFKILFGGIVMVRGNLLMGLRPIARRATARPRLKTLTVSSSN
jgi:hypothetical protein